MREIFTSGSVGGASGNRCFYLEPDTAIIFRGNTMSASLIIELPGSKTFTLSPKVGVLNEESVPYWSKFDHMPCPGNVEHGPAIDYCRLGIEFEKLASCFSGTKSIEKGKITMHYEDGIELSITADAQTMLFNALWFVLLTSNCSVFKYSQWARSNYMPSSDPDRMFYMLFSLFLVEDFIVTPESPPKIDVFKAEMKMLYAVLNNLLERIRSSNQIEADSVSNGVVLFSNLVLLLDMEFDEFFVNLQEKVKTNTVLEKWV